MSPIDAAASLPSDTSAAKSRGVWTLRAIYACALFLSASLMFAVQPMFTKMVLPVLGGSPAVWSVAMVFFQGVLLAGYLYAHFLTKYLRPSTAAAYHLCLITAAWLTLPIAAGAVGDPPAGNQVLWLLGAFGVCLGLPFFALSANGPLLQAWFARTGDPRAHDPYFLYGASNIGSFAALLAYPFLLEPFFGLKVQSQVWSGGFFLLAMLIALCGLYVMRNTQSARVSATTSQAGQTKQTFGAVAQKGTVDVRRFAIWAALGFVPSGLLVSVTAHISTDIAAAPLLWVMPLALFLLTFVIAFRDKKIAAEDKLQQIQFWLAAFVLMSMTGSFLPLIGNLILHLTLFFVSALICHRTLYSLRPASADLTLFYVAMSLGGVLGGMFSALAGPMLFQTILEYPILLVAALFCNRDFFMRLRATRALDFVLPVLAGVILLAIVLILRTPDAARYETKAVAIWMLLFWRSAPAFATGAAVALLLAVLQPVIFNLESHRSFFGVHKIWTMNEGKFRVLSHGTTVHGAMRIRNEDGTAFTGRPEPTAYYAFEGPLGRAIASIRQARGGLNSIFAIGQGAGALACHRKDGERLTFLEIDAAVAQLAGDATKFRYMSECAPEANVVIGDARLTVTKQAGKASVIVVDAFSSDAIPVHLLTREAIGSYLSKLEGDGAILIHVSSQTMDLREIVARAAAEHGLVAFTRSDIIAGDFNKDFRLSSVVIALARKAEHLGVIAAKDRWRPVEPDMKARPWTDDYSTILPAIRAKLRGG